MAIKTLSAYLDVLYGCRFCPMCKPAAEVANATLIESHTTRARAMFLWRVVQGMTDFSARDAELLFQSTLDSISQTWCVHHYPVSEYVVSARHEILKRGYTPETVQKALSRPETSSIDIHDEVIFLADELHETSTIQYESGKDNDTGEKPPAADTPGTENQKMVDRALALLKKGNIHAGPVMARTGFLEFSLGDVDQAAQTARRFVDGVQKGGVKKIIADGPETLWMLSYMLPVLDAPLPDRVVVVSLTEELMEMLRKKVIQAVHGIAGTRVLFHDSRSACPLADEMAHDQAILPDFDGPEELLGTGRVYDIPRSALDSMGVERVFSVWSRSLSKSCGIEGGLWMTYPDLADRLSKKRLEEAQEIGAEMIVTDSPLCARQLRRVKTTGSPGTRWLPELLE
jgi:Fe-S oxidoreductase